MANKDDLKKIEDAMDAPTPMDEEPSQMDEPTPADELTPDDASIEYDETIGDDEPVGEEDQDVVQKPEIIDDKLYTFSLAGRLLVDGKMLRKGEKGHADVFLFEKSEYGKVILKLYQKGRKPKDTVALEIIKHVTAIDEEHLHLVPLLEYGMCKEPETEVERFYELQAYMEGGSLDGVPNNLSERTLSIIVESVCQGLYLLHQACGIRHGDIKISNLFLSKEQDGHIMIGDYDCAIWYGIGTKDSDAFREDWKNVPEMFRRFNVMKKDPEFKELMDVLDRKSCDWVDVAEWIGIFECNNAAVGRGMVATLPLQVIAYLAERDAIQFGCQGKPQFYGSLFAELLENSELDAQADWAQQSLVEALASHKGCAPYTDYTAAWKFVYGLKSENTPPLFMLGDTIISSPEGLKSEDRIAVLDSLRNGHLKEWLAIFYHENPWKNYEVFDYEREVDKYLAFIKELDPQDVNVTRLEEARDEIGKGLTGMKNWRWGITFTQAVCGLLFVIPALLYIGWIVFNGIPIEGNPLTNNVGLGFLVAGAIVGGLLFMGSKGDFEGCGCVISGVIGSLCFGMLFWVLVRFIDIILPIVGWASVLLMLGVGYFVYRTLFNKNLMSTGGESIKRNPDTWIVQPLYYAFDTSQQGYDYRQENLFKDLQVQYRGSLKSMVLKMILPILFAWGMWYGYKAITPELGGEKLETIENQIDKMAGEWNGTFGENQATMQVLNTNRDSFHVSLTVMFKKPVTQTFTGKLEGLKDLTLENDTPDDGVLDGRLDGDFNPEKPDVFRGKYKNYTTEKVYHFTFKKQTSNNDSVQ